MVKSWRESEVSIWRAGPAHQQCTDDSRHKVRPPPGKMSWEGQTTGRPGQRAPSRAKAAKAVR